MHSADPLGGSWLVESMTDELERQAYDYFDRIERLGGVVAALNENFFQREIAEASYRFQQEVEAGQRRIVGVNALTEGDDDPIEILRVPSEVEQRQVARLQAVRADAQPGARSTRRWPSSPRAAATDENVMPHLVECARRLRQRGRDLRRAARGLGRLPGDAGLLAHAASVCRRGGSIGQMDRLAGRRARSGRARRPGRSLPRVPGAGTQRCRLGALRASRPAPTDPQTPHGEDEDRTTCVGQAAAHGRWSARRAAARSGRAGRRCFVTRPDAPTPVPTRSTRRLEYLVLFAPRRKRPTDRPAGCGAHRPPARYTRPR